MAGKAFLSRLIVPQYQSIQPLYDPADLMKKYIEWGVDGIITDRPDLMMGVLKDLGS
jgi:glycerophosphoryl diester phosphodiesterase